MLGALPTKVVLMQPIESWIIAQVPRMARAGQWLMPKPLAAKLLSQLFNHLFADELQAGELDFLADRCLQIEVDDWQLALYISLQQQGLLVSLYPRLADVSMGCDWQSFCLMINQRVDPDTLFFNRRLRLTGDTELGLYVKNFLDGLDLERKLPKPLFSASQQLADRLQS